MPQKRCEYCRGIFKKLAIHQKECLYKKRIEKAKFNSRITQSVEYRTDVLKEFDVDLSILPIEKMTDIGFNDLVVKLNAIKNKNLEQGQKQILFDQAKAEETERVKQLEERNATLNKERKEKEELDRIEQQKRFELSIGQQKEKDAERERLLQEKLNAESPVVQETNVLNTVLTDVVAKYGTVETPIEQEVIVDEQAPVIIEDEKLNAESPVVQETKPKIKMVRPKKEK